MKHLLFEWQQFAWPPGIIGIIVSYLPPRCSFSSTWGSRGNANAQFDEPGQIAHHPDNGLLYVTDTGNHRVQVFRTDGTFVRTWGTCGPGNGQFEEPWGVTIGDHGLVYVADALNHRIQVFTCEGVFVREWGQGHVRYPESVAVDKTSGTMYITDEESGLVLCTRHGKSWRACKDMDACFMGLAIGADGLLYADDAQNHCIKVLTLDGTLVRQWGKYGTGDGEFRNPRGVGFAARSGLVVVCDSGNHRVQLFRPDGSFVCVVGSHGAGSAAMTRDHLFVSDWQGCCIHVFDM